jgi:hypothetical protein
VRKLDQAGATGKTVEPGSDAELTKVLSGQWAAVAVVTRDDVLALRLTLLCGHVRPGIPLWVTLFDRTLIHRLRQEVPSVSIVPSAELVAHELAEHCCAMTVRAPRWRHGVRVVDGALRLLVVAGAGLLGALIVQIAISIIALHETVGRGDDRATLELVGVSRCAVVAAVTSDDLVNVAVGLAASDVKPGIPLALRLGDGGVASETESLLHLGRVFDAHHLAATTLAEAICAKVL